MANVEASPTTSETQLRRPHFVPDQGETEPADPDETHGPIGALLESRTSRRLATPDVDANRLPSPLLECGCDGCSPWTDPLYDSGVVALAGRGCPDPRPLRMERAAEVYRRYVGRRYRDGEPSKVDEARVRYARILEADRERLDRWDPTTVLLSLRLSPLDSDGMLLAPLTLDSMLHGSREPVMNSLYYHLRGYEWDFVAVTTGTEEWATPHTHLYLWARDPEDELDVSDLRPVVEKHVEHCAAAYESDHLSEVDGSDGAITLRHDPPLTTEHPEGETPTTRGAVYVAAQLPHLALLNSQPTDTALEAAATAWASFHHWFSSSRGI